MAINTFRSASDTVEVILTDNLDVVINPSLETIHDIEVILTNRFDGSVLAKFSRELKDGWTQAETTSAHMLLRIPASVKKLSNNGLFEGQLNIIIPDNNMPDGYSVQTYKGIVLAVTEAYTE